MDAISLILLLVVFMGGFVARAKFFDQNRETNTFLAVESTTEESLLPYTAATYIVTRTEHHFFNVLIEAAGDTYHVCPKVRLGDVIRCTDKEWSVYGPPISQKHLDFVLVYRDSMKIACAVELDDSSHDAAHRQRRDRFVNAALAAAGVPIVRKRALPWNKPYGAEKVRRHIHVVIRESKEKLKQP